MDSKGPYPNLTKTEDIPLIRVKEKQNLGITIGKTKHKKSNKMNLCLAGVLLLKPIYSDFLTFIASFPRTIYHCCYSLSNNKYEKVRKKKAYGKSFFKYYLFSYLLFEKQY